MIKYGTNMELICCDAIITVGPSRTNDEQKNIYGINMINYWTDMMWRPIWVYDEPKILAEQMMNKWWTNDEQMMNKKYLRNQYD